MSEQESSKRLSTALPTAEEYALLRKAYAETYPVRPLLNAIDAKDTEIEQLQRSNSELLQNDSAMQRRLTEVLGEQERLCAALEKIAHESVAWGNGEAEGVLVTKSARILQQQWRHKVTGQESTYEWRDVPLDATS